MSSDSKILIIILITMVYLIIQLTVTIYKQFKLIKTYNEQLLNKRVIPLQDSQIVMNFLNTCITQNFEYYKNTILNSLVSSKNKGFFRDEETKDIVVEITKSVLDDLSDDYLEVLNFYIKDVESYVTKKVAKEITPYIVGMNVAKIGL